MEAPPLAMVTPCSDHDQGGDMTTAYNTTGNVAAADVEVATAIGGFVIGRVCLPHSPRSPASCVGCLGCCHTVALLSAFSPSWYRLCGRGRGKICLTPITPAHVATVHISLGCAPPLPSEALCARQLPRRCGLRGGNETGAFHVEHNMLCYLELVLPSWSPTRWLASYPYYTVQSCGNWPGRRGP